MSRYRVRWSRRGKLRYLSANDVDTVLERSVRRAKLPVAYSKGFTPHPKISFATALPVGYGSVAELMDMTLTETLAPEDVKDRFNGGLPDELRIEGVALLDEGTPKLGAIVTGADYEFVFGATWLPEALDRFMALDRYEFVRRFKNEERIDDLRAGVISARVSGTMLEMRCLLQPKAVRPSDVVVALAEIAGEPAPHVTIERVRLLAGEPDALLPIDERGIHEAVTA